MLNLEIVRQLIVGCQDAKLPSLRTSTRGPDVRRSRSQLRLWWNIMEAWVLESWIQDIVARLGFGDGALDVELGVELEGIIGVEVIL